MGILVNFSEFYSINSSLHLEQFSSKDRNIQSNPIVYMLKIFQQYTGKQFSSIQKITGITSSSVYLSQSGFSVISKHSTSSD